MTTSPQRMPDRGRQRVLFAAAVAAVLIGGLWLRVAQLGQPSFWIDEYLHVGAAQEILRSGEPVLPNGQVYTRALPYTYLVVGSFRLFGVSETAARLPSALLGVFVIVVVLLIGRKWFGPAPALVAAALVAVSPVMVSTARMSRMYTLFQILFLCALFAYQRAVESDPVTMRARVGWAVLAAAVAAFSYYIHNLTFHLGIGFIVYWLGMTLVSPRSRHALLLAITAAGVILLNATGVMDVTDLWERARRVPAWMLPPHGPDYYVRWWNDAHPLLLWLVPPAVVYSCRRYGRLGFLLSCQLIAPFLLQSFLLDRKQVRYVSHLFPLFALLVAPLLVAAGHRLWIELRRRLPRWREFPAVARWALAIGLAQAGLLVLAVTLVPTIGGSLSLQDEDTVSGWRPVYERLGSRLQSGDAVVPVVPLAAAYYLGGAGVELVRMDAGGTPAGPPTEPWVVWKSTWPDDIDAEQLREIVERYPRGWWIVDAPRFRNDAIIPPAMRAYVRQNLRVRPELSALSVMVFSWDREDASG